MLQNKKRKVDAEGRVFKNNWTTDFFVIEHNSNILCLICQEKIAVCKEYNVKRHYNTKHSAKYDHMKDQVRIDYINSLKRNMSGQQSLFRIPKENSETVTKISFLISEEIAKRGKPFTDGEFVKNCLNIFASNICPEKKSLVQNISLSHQTVGRRIDDMADNIKITLIEKLKECIFYSLALDESTDISDTAQLAIFIRGVTNQYTIVEELLELCPMKGTTTGRDIFGEVRKTMKIFNLQDENICGLTTDGAPSMIGNQNGFVTLMSNCIKHEIRKHHCIIHQGQLCAKILKMENVMKNVVSTVNFIRSKGLNHRQFQAFLSEVGSDHDDIIYFSHVRWLSRSATLTRFWSLRKEIETFMASKGKDVSYFEDIQWINDLAFLVDITKYLSDLNLKLQGKDLLANQQFENIQAFTKKIDLLQTQMRTKNIVHFTTLSTIDAATINYSKYASLLDNLKNEFDERFLDFKNHEPVMAIFANPFAIDVNTTDAKFQLELIDVQSNNSLKTAYVENDLLTFYQKYIKMETYPNLSKLAHQQIALFGSTYTCEQFFSRMKNVKSKKRTSLTDEHLSRILRISTSKISADIDKLCKQKECQISH